MKLKNEKCFQKESGNLWIRNVSKKKAKIYEYNVCPTSKWKLMISKCVQQETESIRIWSESIKKQKTYELAICSKTNLLFYIKFYFFKIVPLTYIDY